MHSNFSITENLKTNTLSINATFTGDVFPSTEAFISDQSGAKLFLGARKETGGVGDLFGDNKKPLFTVDMQIKFDAKGNFTGVQQGDKLINVADWNKQIHKPLGVNKIVYEEMVNNNSGLCIADSSRCHNMAMGLCKDYYKARSICFATRI